MRDAASEIMCYVACTENETYSAFNQKKKPSTWGMTTFNTPGTYVHAWLHLQTMSLIAMMSSPTSSQTLSLLPCWL